MDKLIIISVYVVVIIIAIVILIVKNIKLKKALANKNIYFKISGKTAVSMCAIFVAVNSGYQAVMLAPIISVEMPLPE